MINEWVLLPNVEPFKSLMRNVFKKPKKHNNKTIKKSRIIHFHWVNVYGYMDEHLMQRFLHWMVQKSYTSPEMNSLQCVCVSVFYYRFAQSQGVGKRASATGA